MPTPHTEPVIDARALRRTFGDVVAVAGIDLTVMPGEVVAVLGPNGAGKTTTIEMLLGLRSPTSGSVRVLGGDPGAQDVRARVGAMLQDTDAPESLTVTEMVALVGAYYPVHLPTDLVVERADLSEHASKRVTQLSGGQRQRLSFALAIVGDPDLLFLDEPTAALDVVARQRFWTYVRAFADLGRTIVFSTHDMSEADSEADRIIVIDRGRIIADAPPAELKTVVAGRTVRLRTDAPLAELSALPGVRHVGLPGRGGAPGQAQDQAPDGTLTAVELHVGDAVEPLRALLSSGRTVTDLTVAEASLTDAFLHLTGRPAARPDAATEDLENR